MRNAFTLGVLILASLSSPTLAADGTSVEAPATISSRDMGSSLPALRESRGASDARCTDDGEGVIGVGSWGQNLCRTSESKASPSLLETLLTTVFGRSS